jgi:hypothetical protein
MQPADPARGPGREARVTVPRREDRIARAWFREAARAPRTRAAPAIDEREAC